MTMDYFSCYSENDHKRETNLAEKAINAKLHGLSMERRQTNTMSTSSKSERLICSTSFSLRLKEEAKRAALLARAASIGHKMAIALKEAAIAIEKEEVLIQTALAMSNARLQVYQKYDYADVVDRFAGHSKMTLDGSMVEVTNSVYNTKLPSPPLEPENTPKPVTAACHMEISGAHKPTATLVNAKQGTVTSNGAGGRCILSPEPVKSKNGSSCILDPRNPDVDYEVDFSQCDEEEQKRIVDIEEAMEKKRAVELSFKLKDLTSKDLQLHLQNTNYGSRSTNGELDTLYNLSSIRDFRFGNGSSVTWCDDTHLNDLSLKEDAWQQGWAQVYDVTQWKIFDPGGPHGCGNQDL